MPTGDCAFNVVKQNEGRKLPRGPSERLTSRISLCLRQEQNPRLISTSYLTKGTSLLQEVSKGASHLQETSKGTLLLQEFSKGTSLLQEVSKGI